MTATRPLLTPKVPPHSEEAEMSVLGGMMLSAAAASDMTARLSADDFYFEKHRTVFKTLAWLVQRQKPVDFVTVTDRLRQWGKLDEVDGMAYLGQLVNDTPGAANVEEYAIIVRERAVLRGLASVGDAITDMAFRPEGRSTSEILDDTERRLLAIRTTAGRAERGPELAAGRWGSMVHAIEQAKAQGGMRGVASGLTDLDRKTRGLAPGDLVIVAGRPSMGKTTLAMNWAEAVSMHQGHATLVFSLEMNTESLLMRFTAAHGRIDFGRLRSGELTDAEWSRLSAVGAAVNDAPLYIDDTAGLTVMQIRARARRQHAKTPLGLLVIDYLQRLNIEDTADNNRARAIGEVTRQLKDLGAELGVPVVLLSQLNRGVENRDNKRPRMADLRESGEIEQDADLIVFVYRDEVYHPDSPERGTAELIVAKQRNGEQGTVRVAFVGHESRFANLSPGWQAQQTPPTVVVPRTLGARPANQSNF